MRTIVRFEKRNIVHNSEPVQPDPVNSHDVLTHVATNLRRLRQQAGISQAALAESAGLSRRMIVQLERGDTNISLASLDRLAHALGTRFVDLVSDPDACQPRQPTVAWRGRQPGSEAILLGSAPARQMAELWSWQLGVGEHYVGEADPPGYHEMLIVTQGRLAIEFDDETLTLDVGQHAIYASSRAYVYRNLSRGITQFIRTVVS